jgi:hypothetical protein
LGRFPAKTFSDEAKVIFSMTHEIK